MAKGNLKRWYYSHDDADAGNSHGSKDGKEKLELIIRKIFVNRSRMNLWRRHNFNNEHLHENFADRFHFKIYSHPIRGAFYNRVEGTILWREWYEYRGYPSGARMLNCLDEPEIVAVILDGSVIMRLDTKSVTERMHEAFPGVFEEDAPIVPIEDVLRRNGYDV